MSVDSAVTPESRQSRLPGRDTSLWLLAFASVSIWVLWRTGALNFAETVTRDGVVYLNGFATVDHPFHSMRAFQLIESLRDGSPIRWITSHQGGYPVEFYPLGVAWIEELVWIASFGSLSIFAVHKLTILLIFLAPGAGYWILTRGDRKSPAVGFLAFAFHLGIAGYWMAGGYTELVSWGLVTNVTGATAALIATGALARFAVRGEAGMAVLAVASITMATYANPRSLIAVAVVGVAVVLASFFATAGPRTSVMTTLYRVGVVAGVAGLTSATEIVSLIRYRDYYYFVNYEAYDESRPYWDATVAAISTPLVWLACGGAIWAILSPRFPVAKIAALALGLYFVVTLALSGQFGDVDVIQQLEAPRLMPYQRMLMLYLAAFFLVRLFDVAANRLSVGKERGIATVATAIVTLVVFVTPVGSIGEDFQGLTDQPQMPMSEMDMFRNAVAQADAVAPDGTSILVLGTRFSWHERLWGSLETDKPLYYEHWLWQWNNEHAGPAPLENGDCTFDNDRGNYYPCPDQTLTPAYLSDHGIGAVVVTDVGSYDDTPNARVAAEASTLLSIVSTDSNWDVYSVTAPMALITDGGLQPTSIDVENERLTASFVDGDGDVLVRVNWFPRWQATVNGESVDISRGKGGYMAIEAPPGPIELELTYSMTAVDWMTRIAAVTGIVIVIGFWLASRSHRFSRLMPNQQSVHR
ncbi:MAG: hypothetical protein WKF81_01825 [Thermomicrobiales bacterium]